MIFRIIENSGKLKDLPSEKKLILDPTLDMDLIEYWEKRLDRLGFKYALVEVSRINKTDTLYFSIMCPDFINEYGVGETFKFVAERGIKEMLRNKGMSKEIEELGEEYED